MNRRLPVAILGLACLSGCATMPMGPQVVVMPAPGKPFNQFMAEDHYCRDFAARAIGMAPSEVGAQNAVAGAVVGTIIGTAAGAALGGHDGAAVGAGMGLLAGSIIGADQGGMAMDASQRRYDISYAQCMYAYGNQLPQAAAPAPPVYYYTRPAPSTVPAPYPPPPPIR